MNASSRYFYSKEKLPEENRVIVSGDEARHMHTVNRLGEGDTCFVINGEGMRWHVAIEEIKRSTVMCRIIDTVTVPRRENERAITLLQAIPRAGAFSVVVEKAVELGIHTVIPLQTEYSPVTVKDDEKFVHKYTVVARNALKQCHRLFDMDIQSPCTVERLGALPGGYDYTVVLDPEAGMTPQVFLEKMRNNAPQRVAVAIGPEGGFSPHEKTLFERFHFEKVCFPDTVFRSETAGVVVSSLLQYGL